MSSPDSSISNSNRNGGKRRLGWLYVLLSITAVFGFLWFVIMPQFSETYMAALRDKIDLAESIDEPKIMLIGNSNVAFGFNSAMLEEAMGMRVVNMGLSAGLGGDYHERMAKINLNPGDIVVIAHTDYQGDDRVEGAIFAWMAMENYLPVWQLMEPQDFPGMFEAFPSYVGMAIKRWINEYDQDWLAESDPEACREAYNEYGDIKSPRVGNVFEFKDKVPGFLTPQPMRIQRLNELYQYVTERGAYMAVTACPYPTGEYSTPSNFISFYENLAPMLDCPVICDPREQLFDYSLFYKYYVHLSDEGARIRTELLVDDLNAMLHPDVTPVAEASDGLYIKGVNPNLLPDGDNELRPVNMDSGLVSDWTDWSGLGLSNGETVTLSAFVKPEAEGDQLTLHLSAAAAPEETMEILNSNVIDFEGETDYAFITFVYDESKPYVRVTLTGENENETPVTGAQVKQLKLERGELRTGYYLTVQ